ncbi:MAG: NUDIX hydrolase [Pseudonocardiaceae bacterium]
MSSPLEGSEGEEIRTALRCLRRRGARRWGSKRVAMAVTVVTGADGPAVLLTRRADSVRNAQFALPGGRTDRWESASDAARRQLAEELGMRPPPQAVLGLLDDYVTHTRLVITPVVLWAGEHPQPRRPHLAVPEQASPQAHTVEVAEIIAVPFTDLDVEPVFVASSQSGHPVIRLPLRGGWLHAPTAVVLHQFREVVLHHRRTRVAHLQQPVYPRR